MWDSKTSGQRRCSLAVEPLTHIDDTEIILPCPGEMANGSFSATRFLFFYCARRCCLGTLGSEWSEAWPQPTIPSFPLRHFWTLITVGRELYKLSDQFLIFNDWYLCHAYGNDWRNGRFNEVLLNSCFWLDDSITQPHVNQPLLLKHPNVHRVFGNVKRDWLRDWALFVWGKNDVKMIPLTLSVSWQEFSLLCSSKSRTEQHLLLLSSFRVLK